MTDLIYVQNLLEICTNCAQNMTKTYDLVICANVINVSFSSLNPIIQVVDKKMYSFTILLTNCGK